MKLNVLHIIDSFESGGTERQAIQLVRMLHNSGRGNVRLACLQNYGSLRVAADEIGTGEIFEYPLTSFYDWNFVVQLQRLRRFIRKNQINVIHTHCFYTNIFGTIAAALSRVPVRLTFKGETAGFRTATQKRIERAVFRLSHCVIANSDAVREQLISEGVAARKIVRHYNGLDLNRVAVAADLTRQQILQMFGLPERRFVTIVANLRHRVKDYPMFLRAAARVRASVPDAGFIVAGEGELMPELEELAGQLQIASDVFFIGRCEKLAELLSISEVCALSSKAEGFSNAILEYMAAARPVVVTDVGGAREAVVDGESGYLVASGDDEQMANRIIRLLRNQEEARLMGLRGRAIIEEKFSTELQLKTTLSLYERLLRQADSANLPLRPKIQESV